MGVDLGSYAQIQIQILCLDDLKSLGFGFEFGSNPSKILGPVWYVFSFFVLIS